MSRAKTDKINTTIRMDKSFSQALSYAVIGSDITNKRSDYVEIAVRLLMDIPESSYLKIKTFADEKGCTVGAAIAELIEKHAEELT